MSLQEIRCEKCRRLLAKEEILYGEIEIRCPYCNKMSIYRYLADVFTADVLVNI